MPHLCVFLRRLRLKWFGRRRTSGPVSGGDSPPPLCTWIVSNQNCRLCLSAVVASDAKVLSKILSSPIRTAATETTVFAMESATSTAVVSATRSGASAAVAAAAEDFRKRRQKASDARIGYEVSA